MIDLDKNLTINILKEKKRKEYFIMSNFKKNLGLCMLGIGVFSLVGCGTPNKPKLNNKELNNVEVSETLPLGTIVTLKEGEQELMIIIEGIL